MASAVARSTLISSTPQWAALKEHVAEVNRLHLRELLRDARRSAACRAEHRDIILDYSRQRVTPQTLDLLYDLAEAVSADAIFLFHLIFAASYVLFCLCSFMIRLA